MPLQLTAPIIKIFTLDASDKKYGNEGEPTTVTIRQATQGQHAERQSLFSTLERKWSELDPDQVSLVTQLSSAELMRMEVWLTLTECNLLDEEGDLLFPSKKNGKGDSVISMTRKQFNDAWAKLFPDVALEIHSKVLEVNPLWKGPAGEES